MPVSVVIMSQLSARPERGDGGIHRQWGMASVRMTYGNDKPISQASAKGKVKWFNATKGYGFITLDAGGDAFCHASALQSTGHSDVPPGTTIVCDLADSQRGLQVVAVHSVDITTAEAPSRGPRRDFGSGGRDFGGGGRDFGGGGFGGGGFGGGGFGHHRDNGPSGPMVEGKVKFFNDQKGFGFVMPDSGSGDIYLHASALRRSGVQAVEPDQRIRYSTRQGNKGVEVDRVEII
jgi:CspA family cold shock protein